MSIQKPVLHLPNLIVNGSHEIEPVDDYARQPSLVVSPIKINRKRKLAEVDAVEPCEKHMNEVPGVRIAWG